MKTINNSSALRQVLASMFVIAMITSFGVAPLSARADGVCPSGQYDTGNGCADYLQPYTGTSSYDNTSSYDYTDNYSDYGDYSNNYYDDSADWYSFGLNLTYNDTDIKNQTNNYGYSSPNYGYTYNDTPYNYGDYHGSNVTYVYDNHSYDYGNYTSPKPVPTCNINANDTSITRGQSVTLSWSANNATSGSITDLGSVGTSGSRTVSPNNDTTYTYSVSGQGGNSTCSVNINVDDNRDTAAPSCSLEVSDSSIDEGDSTTLRWYVTGNADSASINEGIGSVDESGGSKRVSPDTDTTYRLTVRGEGGSRTCSATVNVDPDNQNNVSLNITPVDTIPNQPYTSVYLADAPYTGAGDTAAVVGSILALVAAALIGGYFLFMKAAPLAFKRATVGNAPVVASENTKKTVAKTIRVGGIDQNEVYAFMTAFASNDTQTMQAIRSSIKAQGIDEARLASRVNLAATDALTARKFGGATENALLSIDNATLEVLAA